MKNILLIIFAILVFCIGSNSEIFALTGVFEKDRILLAKQTESTDGHRQESAEYRNISEIEQNVFVDCGENQFYCEDLQGGDFSLELIFFLSMLIFTTLLVMLHFWSKNPGMTEFQQFD